MTSTRGINFSLLLHRKKTLFVSGLVAAAIAFMISRVLPLRYVAEGGMVVENATEGPVAPDEGAALVQTQIDVLTSTGLISRVVHDLDIKPELGLEPTLRLPDEVTALLTAARDYVQEVWRSTGDYIQGVWPPVGNAGHVLGGGHVLSDGHDQTVTLIQKQLQVESKDHSKLVFVRLMAGSPDVAARVVNAIMRAYISGDVDGRNHRIATINAYIAQQTKAMGAEIDAAQKQLLTFSEQHNMPEIAGGSAAALQLSKDQEQLSIARDQLALRQAAFDTMSHGGSVQGSEETLESQTIQSLKNFEAQTIQQIDTLSPTDPRRISLQAGLDSIRAQLKRENELIYASVARNVAIARAKVLSLETAVEMESARSQDVAVAGVRQQQLKSELDSKHQLYLAFLSHAEQLRTVAEGSASAHIMFEAAPPEQPTATYGSLSLIVGFLGGMFTAAGTIVLRDAFGTRVNTTIELELVTGLPVFGSLPDIKQLRGGGVSPARRETVAAIAETFRAMWIWTRSKQKDRGTTLVVTSSELGEGKSTLVTALAQRLAEDGFRVLLIDTDLRRPRLAAMLKIRPAHFVESVLANDVTVAQATVRDTRFGFDCLLANGRSRNPVKALLSDEFKQLLSVSQRAYDYVLLDSPPVLQVVDPTLIGNLCDYILFVVQAGRVSRELVGEATRRFGDAERQRILTVLTRVQPGDMDRRDYYGGYSKNPNLRLPKVAGLLTYKRDAWVDTRWTAVSDLSLS